MKAGLAKVLPWLIGVAVVIYIVKQPEAAGTQAHGLLAAVIDGISSVGTFLGRL
jgi:hypothetical protein